VLKVGGRRFFSIITILLTACAKPSVKLDDLNPASICKASVAAINKIQLTDLITRYLKSWDYYSVSYIRESDGQIFNYFCRPQNGKVLIKSDLSSKGSNIIRLYYQLDGRILQLRKQSSANTAAVALFRLDELE